MLSLKSNPTMKDYQVYVAGLVQERGFADETIPEIFILFVEEIGEIVRAIFESEDKPGVSSEKASHEISDLFTYLLDIANHYDVDVGQAFREQFENQASSLKPASTLAGYQEYARHLVTKESQSTEALQSTILWFVAEVGELARAIRKSVGVKIDRSAEAKYRPVSTQIARCLMGIVKAANTLGVDIEQAFRSKEELNKARFWSRAQEKRV